GAWRRADRGGRAWRHRVRIRAARGEAGAGGQWRRGQGAGGAHGARAAVHRRTGHHRRLGCAGHCAVPRACATQRGAPCRHGKSRVIGSLRGVLAGKEPPRLLVEVQGVGYEVEVPMSTYLTLPPAGSTVHLLIHHVLREDASLLFGFATVEERELFRALLKVNGVGPKVALAILSGVSAGEFRQAIAAEDAAALVRIPGVGRKTAERLLVEMRDHFREAAS